MAGWMRARVVEEVEEPGEVLLTSPSSFIALPTNTMSGCLVSSIRRFFQSGFGESSGRGWGAG